MVICFFHVLVVIWFGLGLCCLTPLLAIFQLWGSVLLVEETGVPRKNHRPVASHWQTWSHNVVSSIPRLGGVRSHNVSGDRYCSDLVSWTFTPYLSIFRIISYSWPGADPGFQVFGIFRVKNFRGGYAPGEPPPPGSAPDVEHKLNYMKWNSKKREGMKSDKTGEECLS